MKSKGKKGQDSGSWIEASFQKRECAKFIPSSKDEHRCCCGLSRVQHRLSAASAAATAAATTEKAAPPGPEGSVGTLPQIREEWSVARHTVPSPTDAYGTIEFQGGPHCTKSQFIRLAHDSRPELILQLLTREWNLELPKLLITVQGGKANFELQPKLKKVLGKGLLEAAKSTGAWLFTGGTNTGVTRQVGDALLLERSQRSGRVVSIGIAPWGIVENNHELIGRNRDVPYHAIASPRSKLAVLNSRHAYFLLVDNGTAGRYGAEIILRRKLEKYISNQKLHPCTHCSTPVVCLVIEGGTNTIRAVLEYVTDSPPVPVVVCDGSGRAADLLAFTHRHAMDNGEQTLLESKKEGLIATIRRTFEVGQEQAECLYSELLQCTRNKNLITVFRISDLVESSAQELDQTILTALFKSQHLSPSDQLSLALTWNRVDIARSEIFVYGQEWPPGALDEAMMLALEHDRLDFVKLLLENGVSMRKFLTIPRLEELYNTKQGPTNTLGYILRDVRPHIPRGYVYTLHDIGLVINKLMGGAYRAHYTRRKFRMIYAKVMKKSPNVHRNSASFIRYCGQNNTMLSLLAGSIPTTPQMPYFDYPFNELLTWAVLTKRQQMALLMWQHGEEALAKALVACKLYKAMAHEAAEDDLETEIYEELRSYAKDFENIALELLDYCYRQDDDQTQQLLTCELQNWSGQTCLSLAVSANHRALLAHPCSQIILADLWMGGLRTRKNTNIKVILSLMFPPYITQLDFKSKEELQIMPHTEEEHQLFLEEDEEESAESGVSRSVGGSSVGGGSATPSVTKSEVSRRKNTEPDIEQAFLTPEYGTTASTLSVNRRESFIQENGKVVTLVRGGGDGSGYCDIGPTLLYHPELEVKNERPLGLKKKLYEFYTAPISKFWGHSIAYMVFLVLFSYAILVRMPPTPTWPEVYVIGYICAFGCEKFREIASSEPVGIKHKFAVWAWNMWNPCDAVAVVFFLIGLVLRLDSKSMDVGRLLFCIDIIYWYLRIFTILSVNKYLGPLVTMMGKMVKNMIYFVVLLLVVLVSFGVCRQAILYPDKEASWLIVKEIFFQPYFMLYGEVFADGIDPPCGEEPGMEPCITGRWVSPVVMAIYLLVANILLINLLIAVFNNIFNEVNAVSHQVWMFQRFTVVMEYEQKPVLPPPLILLCHLYLLLKTVMRKLRGRQSDTYDNGLKVFLEPQDLDRLYDFEEECVEGYFCEKEMKLHMSTDERIKTTADRVDHMGQKVEDIYQKENLQSAAIQTVEYRIRRLEELAEQTVTHLGVIHKFMAARSQDIIQAPSVPPPAGSVGGSAQDVRGSISESRLRRASERSDSVSAVVGAVCAVLGTSESSDTGSDFGVAPLAPTLRRRPNRSLPEVRPDATEAAAMAFQFQYPLLVEEEGSSPEHDDDVVESAAAAAAAAATVDAFRPGSQTLGPDDMAAARERAVAAAAAAAAAAAVVGRRTRRASEAEQLSAGRQERERSLSLGGDDNERGQAGGVGATPVFLRTQSHSGGCATPLPNLLQGATSHTSSTTSAPTPVRQISQQSESEAADSTAAIAAAAAVAAAAAAAATAPHRSVAVERSVTWAEPRIQVIPPTSATSRAVLRSMHNEYTSITDELETVCGLLPAPVTPSLLSPPSTTSGPVPVGPPVGQSVRSRVRHASEMSNSEIAIYLEKETLRDAEESDYKLMEDLINRRYELEDTESASLDMERFGNNAFFLPVTDETDYRSGFGSGRALRRSSAIEVPPPEELLASSTTNQPAPLPEEEVTPTPTPGTSSAAAAAAHTQAQQLSARLRKSSISDSKGSLVPPSMETMC